MPVAADNRVFPKDRPAQGAGHAPNDEWRLIGKLAPAIVGLWVVLDVLLRFAGPSFLHLDPWLEVSKLPPRYSPFAPDQTFYEPVYVGGDARGANVRPTEFGGPIKFSTDHLGFRKNPYLRAGQTPEVLFLQGDSFTYGVGLSDEQTLPSVITAKYGIPSYNGGRFHDDPDGMPELDWLLQHLPGRPSAVVFTYLEHRPLIAPVEEAGWEGAIKRWSPQVDGDLRYCKLVNTFFWLLSPTHVMATRFFNQLAQSQILPNSGGPEIRVLPLPDGRKMLFQGGEFELPMQDRGPGMVSQTVRGMTWLKSELAERHLKLIVLLLPSRYTVYAPVLANNDGPWTHYLDRVDEQLYALGINSVNGLAVYRSAARQEVQDGRLSFFREDLHWNPQGVERIAGPVAQAINHSIQMSR